MPKKKPISKNASVPKNASVVTKTPVATKAPTAKNGAVRAAPHPKKPLTHPVKLLSARDAPLVNRLRKVCLALPEAGERLSHGEPTWFAGKGKVFAMLDNHHHGSSHLGVWLPQPPDVQHTLLTADPDRFYRPPYVGPRGWVGIVLDTKPDWNMVERLVRDAFVHVASKALVAKL